MSLSKNKLQALIDAELVIYYTVEPLEECIRVSYDGGYLAVSLNEEFSFKEAKQMLDAIFTPVAFKQIISFTGDYLYSYCSPKYIKGVYREANGETFMLLKSSRGPGYGTAFIAFTYYQQLLENNCYHHLPYLSKQVFNNETT